jgi:alpha-beta hydrolase superfamily lysophospholipase
VLAARLPYNAEVQFFDGFGHDMMLEPEWRSVAERIVDWLRTQLHRET